MSEFLILARRPPTPCPIDVRLAAAGRERLVHEAAAHVFGDDAEGAVFVEPVVADELLEDALRAVEAGEGLAGTRLGWWLRWVVASRTPMAMFYGSDFDDLPSASREDEVLRVVEQQLPDPGREVYVRYVP